MTPLQILLVLSVIMLLGITMIDHEHRDRVLKQQLQNCPQAQEFQR